MATDRQTKELAQLLAANESVASLTSFSEIAELRLFVAFERFYSERGEVFRFHTISTADTPRVLCFSSAELLSRWDSHAVHPVEMSLAELLPLLPSNFGLALNPGEDETSTISTQKSTQVGSGKSYRAVNFKMPECKKAAPQPEVSLYGPSPSLNQASFEDLLKSEIASICQCFSQVEEAYFLFRPDRHFPTAVVGLLCAGLHAELRYELVDRLARVSRKYFSNPSAIEVFDDLDVRNSRSWEIFRALLPIYPS